MRTTSLSEQSQPQSGTKLLMTALLVLLVTSSGQTQPALTCNGDDIFVGNIRGSVVRFSKADIAINGNSSTSTIIGTGLGALFGMTLDFDGTVIVTTGPSNTIYRFDRTGIPKAAIGTISNAFGLSIDSVGNLFVNQLSTPITYKAGPSGGFNPLAPVVWINTFSGATTARDTRISPSSAPLFHGALYSQLGFGIPTQISGVPTQIQAWSSTTPNTFLGTVVSDFGTAAGLGAGAYRSAGMAFDSQGDIWVSDFTTGAGEGRLLEFSAAAGYAFSRMVTIPSSSRVLEGIVISARNPADPLNPNKDTIFVTDFNNSRLYVLDEVTGNVLHTLNSNLGNPTSVAVCDVVVQPPAPVSQCPPSPTRPKLIEEAPPATLMVGSGDVVLTVLRGEGAAFNNLVGLASPINQEIYFSKTEVEGTRFSLGPFAPNSELILRITTPQGFTFVTGPGERNLDGIVHANIVPIDAHTFIIGLEDLFGGGDFDYDDVYLQLCGDLSLQPPCLLACPQNLLVCNEAGSCGAIVSYPPPKVEGDCAGAFVSCTPPPGSFFGVGTNKETCTASDGARIVSGCTFEVAVGDCEPPVAGCLPGVNPAGNLPGARRVAGFYQFTARDNCDPAPQLFIGDTASDFVAGPYQDLDFVKITQAPGVSPNAQKMAEVVKARIQLA